MTPRTLLPILAALALVAFLPAPAAAQQSGALVLTTGTPDALRPDGFVTYTVQATLTVDYTAALALSGIPVTYVVENKPAWASVTLSPASDVFPPPPAGYVPSGFAYQQVRILQVTIAAGPDAPTVDVYEALELGAITSPGMFGQPIYGRGSTVVFYDAPEEEPPCPEHAFTDAQIAQMTATAVDAYNEHEAKDSESSDDVSVQSTGASPVPVAGIAVAGFALVGAGVGLLLRRRMAS